MRLTPTLIIATLRAANIAAKLGLSLAITNAMGLEALGLYGLILSTTLILPALAGLGHGALVAREASTATPAQTVTATAAHWLRALTLYLITGIVGCAFFGNILPPHLQILALIITAAEHINNDAYMLLLHRNRLMFANVLNTLRNTAWVLPFSAIDLLVPAWANTETLLTAWAMGTLVPLIILGWRYARSTLSSLQLTRSAVRQTCYPTPYYLTDIANVLAQYADRYLISLTLGLAETGAYVFFWQVGKAVYNLATSSVVHLYRHTLTTAFAEGNSTLFWNTVRTLRHHNIRATGLLMLAASGATLGIVWLAMPQLFPYWPLLGFVMLQTALLVHADITATTLFARREDARITRSTLALLALSLVGTSGALLLGWGVYGVVTGNSIALAAVIVWRIMFLHRARLNETPTDDGAVIHVGGLPITRYTRDGWAKLAVTLCHHKRADPTRPAFVVISANGNVLAQARTNPVFKHLMLTADAINPDGQPLVATSHLTATPLPERVATTDLFHHIARAASDARLSIYLLGTTQQRLDIACAAIARQYPRLTIAGARNGYFTAEQEAEVVAAINASRADILFVGLGVPKQEEFVIRHKHALTVGFIKTCGGLFDYFDPTIARAPQWVQNSGLEWLFRTLHEPRRLAWRYATTNTVALWSLLTDTRFR